MAVKSASWQSRRLRRRSPSPSSASCSPPPTRIRRDMAKDPLALNGYPPQSADLVRHRRPRARTRTLSANVNVNFANRSRRRRVVHFPLVFTTVAVDLTTGRQPPLRAPGRRLERTVARRHRPAARPLRHLARDDEARHRPHHRVSTKTRDQERLLDDLPLLSRRRRSSQRSSASPKRRRRSARFARTITVGSQGEVTGTMVTLKKSTVKVTREVLSYNQPITSTPPSRDLEPLSTCRIRQTAAASTSPHCCSRRPHVVVPELANS